MPSTDPQPITESMDAPKPIDIEADFVALSTNPTDSIDNTAEFADQEDFAGLPEDSDPTETLKTRKTYSELREVQRLLMDDMRSVATKPSERAQCARAYRDIEIVRRAIRGKPLVLNATAKVDLKPRQGASPLIVMDVDDAKSA